MMDQREEKYVFDNIGSLRTVITKAFEQMKDEDIRDILKMVKYVQIHYEPTRLIQMEQVAETKYKVEKLISE